MARALDLHVTLLGRYIEAARKGDAAYLGEIAGKLRLLVIEKSSQKSLLLRLANLTGDELTVRIDGPPGWEFAGGYVAGDDVPVSAWLSSFAMSVGTPSGPVKLSNAEFICTWAEQYGAAHEDWNLLEAFKLSFDWGDQMQAASGMASLAQGAPPEMAAIFGALAAGPSPNVRKLLNLAIGVHRVARAYLDSLTEEKLRAAEDELRSRQGRPSLAEEAAQAEAEAEPDPDAA